MDKVEVNVDEIGVLALSGFDRVVIPHFFRKRLAHSARPFASAFPDVAFTVRANVQASDLHLES